MSMNVGQIGNPQILIAPSTKFRSYIANIKIVDDMPFGIKNIVFKNKQKNKPTVKSSKLDYLVTEDDKKFIKSLTDKKTFNLSVSSANILKPECVNSNANKLNLQDLHWLSKYIEKENKNNDIKVYLHELMENSEIILPKNQEIPRSEELERRCQKLKQQQQNLEYKNMTRNVDNSKRQAVEDTIGYQLRMMNKQLIAVIQFIISVLAAFAFGFMGVEILAGTLDFGIRLILGIICAIIVAIAELYFLAKHLNDDLEFEHSSITQTKKVS